MATIRIISKANGVGLSRDIELIAAALREIGTEIEVVPVGKADTRLRRSRARQLFARAGAAIHGSGLRLCDLNVMLEHAWPHYLGAARLNVLVPNPEWCDRHDRRRLSDFDSIWAKTDNTHSIFTLLGLPSYLIGFDSEDRYDPTVTREVRCLHLAGKSPLKGTARLMEVWMRHPEWPTLIVVRSSGLPLVNSPAISNVRIRRDYIDDAELRRLQNTCKYHICMSEVEGWGHYLVEGMSVGATVITVDAPPMNEVVTRDRGLLVAWSSSGQQNLAMTFQFGIEAFESAMTRALALTTAESGALGRAARDWAIANKRGFAGRIRRALEVLGL